MKKDYHRIEEAFSRHENEPHMSAEDYVRSLRINLGKSLNEKELIYLDKCFWIFIRDVVLNRKRSSMHADLLLSLRELVSSGKAICPISDSLFLELLKQSDHNTKRATAQLIDELSTGITLAPTDERIGTEIAHFIYSHVDRQHELYPLNWLVWLKLCYVLGVTYPIKTAFESKTELLFQKAFVDYLWGMPLLDMVAILAEGEVPPLMDFSLVAHQLNEGSAAHAHEIKSYRQAYLAELSGGLEITKGQTVDIIKHLFEKATGDNPIYSREERLKYEKEIYSFFVNLFRFKGNARELPTLHIHAKCHAAVRWDKKRKIKPNDIYDFHHAAAAIGYCNAFFTDYSLRDLLTANHVALDKEFNCRVISDEEQAVLYLNEIK